MIRLPGKAAEPMSLPAWMIEQLRLDEYDEVQVPLYLPAPEPEG